MTMTLRRKGSGKLRKSPSGVEDHSHVDIADLNNANTQEEPEKNNLQATEREEEDETLPSEKPISVGHHKSVTLRELWLKLSTAIAVVMLIGLVFVFLPVTVTHYRASMKAGSDNGWVGCWGGNDYTWPASESPCNMHELFHLVYSDYWDIQAFDKEGFITVSCRFTEINIGASSATVSCDLNPYGTYAAVESIKMLSVPSRYNSSSNLVVYVGYMTQSFSAGEPVGSVAFTLPLLSNSGKSVFFYPYFVSRFGLLFSAYWKEPNGSAHDAALAWMFEYNDLPPYIINADFSYNVSSNTYPFPVPRVDSFYGMITLHPLFTTFVVILVVTIWVLVFILTVVSVFEVFRAKLRTKPSFDLLSAACALLFALPSMRGVLPGSPPVGIQYDVYGIVGQLMMISVVCFCLVQHRSRDKSLL